MQYRACLRDVNRVGFRLLAMFKHEFLVEVCSTVDNNVDSRWLIWFAGLPVMDKAPPGMASSGHWAAQWPDWPAMANCDQNCGRSVTTQAVAVRQGNMTRSVSLCTHCVYD